MLNTLTCEEELFNLIVDKHLVQMPERCCALLVNSESARVRCFFFFKDATCQNPEPPGYYRRRATQWHPPVSGVLRVLVPVVISNRQQLPESSGLQTPSNGLELHTAGLPQGLLSLHVFLSSRIHELNVHCYTRSRQVHSVS